MSDNLDYLAFLRRKIKLASFAGFDGVQYLRAVEREVSMPSLFDGIELEEAA